MPFDAGAGLSMSSMLSGFKILRPGGCPFEPANAATANVARSSTVVCRPAAASAVKRGLGVGSPQPS